MTAHVPWHIDPTIIDILEIFHLVRAGLKQKTFLDPDWNEVCRRNDDVEAVATGPDLGKGSVIRSHSR